MDPLVTQLWDEYRSWALTARAAKKKQRLQRLGILSLTIGGAFLATLSQQLPSWLTLSAATGAHVARVVGGVGALAIAVAAFLTRALLAPERVKAHLKMRAFAERLKRETFLYLTGLRTAAEARTTVTDVAEQARRALLVRSVKSDRQDPPVKGSSMSWQEYAAGRLQKQIEFFEDGATAARAAAERGRRVMIVAGLFALCLTVGVAADFLPGAAVWASVVTSAAGAFWASHATGNYDYLSITYDAMLTRLRLFQTERPSNALEEQSLVQRIEDTLRTENDAWLAELTSDSIPPPAPSSTTTPAASEPPLPEPAPAGKI